MALKKPMPVRTFPAGGTVVELPELGAVVCSYTTDRGTPACLAYRGRGKKPIFNFAFPNNSDKRDEHLKTWIVNRRRDVEQQAEFARRVEAERSAFAAALVPGSIFYVMTSYEQEITEDRPLAMTGYALPVKGKYTSGDQRILLRSLDAKLWNEGDKVCVSWYG